MTRKQAKSSARWVLFVVDPKCDTTSWSAKTWEQYFYTYRVRGARVVVARVHTSERSARLAVRALLERAFKSGDAKPFYGVAQLAGVDDDGAINLQARIDGVDAVGVLRELD